MTPMARRTLTRLQPTPARSSTDSPAARRTARSTPATSRSAQGREQARAGKRVGAHIEEDQREFDLRLAMAGSNEMTCVANGEHRRRSDTRSRSLDNRFAVKKRTV